MTGLKFYIEYFWQDCRKYSMSYEVQFIPIEDVMKHFEITDADLAETKELEIE